MKKTFSISEAISFGWNTFKSNWKFWIVASVLVMAANSANFSYENTYRGNLIPKNTSNTNSNLNYKNPSSDQKVGSLTFLNMQNSKPNVLGKSTVVGEGPSTLPKSFLSILPIIVIALIVLLPFMILMSLARVIFRMGFINLTLDAVRNKDLYYKTLLNQVSFKKALRLIGAEFLVGLLVIIGSIFFIIPGIMLSLKYFFVGEIMVDQDTKIGESLKRSSDLTKGVRFKLLLLIFTFLLVGFLGLLALGVGIFPAAIVINLAKVYVYNKLLEQSGMQVNQKSTEVPLPPITSGSLLAENLPVQDSLTVTE